MTTPAPARQDRIEILVLDDEALVREAIQECFASSEHVVTTTGNVDEAMESARSGVYDLLLLDLRLEGQSGIDLISDFLRISPWLMIVLITGHASVDTAVEALRRGVTDYLTKPLDVSRLREILGNIAKTSQLPQEIQTLRTELGQSGRFGSLVVRSPAMQRTCELIARIAPSSASVLITGESGTGKDVVASAIHDLSRRRHGPFVPVNCGAISPALMESELFGHERGSFTGADRRHRGVFERADRVIKRIANEEKYDLILQEAVFRSPRIDITDKVLKALAEGK